MREQVASPVLSSSFNKKKTSVKISGGDENHDSRRRLSSGNLSYFGGKSIVNMPGGALKGGTSINFSKEQDLESSLATTSLGKIKEEAKMEFENEGNKRRAADDDVLLQWGDRKRPRCTRLEPKHATDESCVLSKKTIRVDRRVVKAEKQLIVSQTPVAPSSRGHLLRPCTPSVREIPNGVVRRNGQDLNASLNGITTSNVFPSVDARHLALNTPERADTQVPVSPEDDTAAGCVQSTDRGSPEACTLTVIENGGEAVQAIPAMLEKVDLELFEWPRILISLSRKEKEDDFMAMKGTKLPQRPKRRPKVVEKALLYCSPGHWLSDLTRGRYEVREKKSVKKKPRGLKAMDSMESDSE